MTEAMATDYKCKMESFYEKVDFDTWLEMKSIRICSLPREARLVFTLYGRKTVKADKEQVTKKVKQELGWGSIQLFDYMRYGCKFCFFS